MPLDAEFWTTGRLRKRQLEQNAKSILTPFALSRC